MRQSKGLTADAAAKYAAEMLRLTMKARHVVRDWEPKVRRRRYEVEFLLGLEDFNEFISDATLHTKSQYSDGMRACTQAIDLLFTSGGILHISV